MFTPVFPGYKNKGTYWEKSAEIINDHGYETLLEINPKFRPKNGKNKLEFTRQHESLFASCLHVAVSQRNWNMAYKVFSLIVKMHISNRKRVMFKKLWPWGLLILHRLEADDIRTQIHIELHVPMDKIEEVFDLSSLTVTKNIFKYGTKQDLWQLLESLKDSKYQRFTRWLNLFHAPGKTRFILIYLWSIVPKLSQYLLFENATSEIFQGITKHFRQIMSEIDDFMIQMSFKDNSVIAYTKLIVVILEKEFLSRNLDNSNANITETTIQVLFNKAKELSKQLCTNKQFQINKARLEKMCGFPLNIDGINDDGNEVTKNMNDSDKDIDIEEEISKDFKEDEEDREPVDDSLDHDSLEQDSEDEFEKQLSDASNQIADQSEADSFLLSEDKIDQFLSFNKLA